MLDFFYKSVFFVSSTENHFPTHSKILKCQNLVADIPPFTSLPYLRLLLKTQLVILVWNIIVCLYVLFSFLGMSEKQTSKVSDTKEDSAKNYAPEGKPDEKEEIGKNKLELICAKPLYTSANCDDFHDGAGVIDRVQGQGDRHHLYLLSPPDS